MTARKAAVGSTPATRMPTARLHGHGVAGMAMRSEMTMPATPKAPSREPSRLKRTMAVSLPTQARARILPSGCTTPAVTCWRWDPKSTALPKRIGPAVRHPADEGVGSRRYRPRSSRNAGGRSRRATGCTWSPTPSLGDGDAAGAEAGFQRPVGAVAHQESLVAGVADDEQRPVGPPGQRLAGPPPATAVRVTPWAPKVGSGRPVGPSRATTTSPPRVPATVTDPSGAEDQGVGPGRRPGGERTPPRPRRRRGRARHRRGGGGRRGSHRRRQRGAFRRAGGRRPGPAPTRPA